MVLLFYVSSVGLKIEAEDLKMSDLVDMKQLEYLLRISIMAASISGQGFSGYNNYCFSAYGYLHRMWQVRAAASCMFSVYNLWKVQQIRRYITLFRQVIAGMCTKCPASESIQTEYHLA